MRKLILFLFITSAIFAKAVGIISAVKGNVKIERGGNLLKARLGSKINETDSVITYKNGKAQLLFKDKTIISIGKSSKVLVDEYVFNGTDSKAKFKILNGAFKAMTGKIGKLNPDKFKVATKTSTIGIRGTHFLGVISPEEDTVACTQGKIEVASNAGGLPVEVNAGQITFVKPGDLPTPPRDFTVGELKKMSRSSGTSNGGTTDTESTEDTKEEEPATEEIEEIAQEAVETVEAQKVFETCNYNTTLKGFMVGTTNGVNSNDLVLKIAGGQKWSYSDSYYYDADNYYSYSIDYCLNSVSGGFTSGDDTYSLGTKVFYEDSNGEIGTSVASHYGEATESGYSNGESYTYDGFYAGASVDGANLTTEQEIATYGGFDEYDYTLWGEWYSITPDEADPDAYFFSFNTVGYWVAGEETSSGIIDSYQSQNKSIAYSGTLHGSVLDYSSFSMTYDFGSAEPISGTFGGSGVNSAGSAISGNTFSGSAGTDINFDGKFYGPNASEIGGKYSTSSGSGIFIGKDTTVQ